MMNDMDSDPDMMTIWMSDNPLLKSRTHDDDDDIMEPAGVLNSKAEHNERHRSFWYSIVLLQDVSVSTPTYDAKSDPIWKWIETLR